MANEQEQPAGGAEDWAPWRNRIAAARKRRDDLVATWQDNVDTRRGKLHSSGFDSTTGRTSTPTGVIINQDWPITKAKIANLYSNTPEVRLTPRWPEFEAAVPVFARELNDTIADCSVGSTIEEVLSDVVNASGIGAVIISCDKRTEQVLMPKVDPMIAGMTGAPPEMVPVTRVADLKYLVERISPADLLVPSDFTGSNYNHARWLGHEGRMTWAQAQAALGLTDDQKDNVLGTDKRASGTTNTLNTDSLKFKDTEVVNFQQLFYWRHFYDKDETNFHALGRLVFIDGVDDPIEEPYQVQKRLPDGRIVGVKLNPIQVLTLTYISDDALPPSDCSIARPAIDELEQSRSSMMEQRKHSIPVRWFNPSLVSPNARAQVEKGTFHGFIPVNGTGDRAIGEVARATFPSENFEFDRIIKGDITETVQTGTNQNGGFASGERSAREAGIVEQHFQRRQGQEQDKVQRFVLSIAEVLAGHLALYGTFDVPDALGQQRQAMANAFVYSVSADATVRKSAKEQIDELEHLIDRSAQSPFCDVRPLMAKWYTLHGIDPATIIMEPKPKPPEPVNISLKGEDLINPMALAFTYRTGQGPGPEDLAASIKAFQAALTGVGPEAVVPQQQDDRPPRDGDTPGIANPDWQMAPRQDKRDEDGGA